jgi:undecaprenyl-diphosphatase
MNEAIFHLINQFAGRSAFFDQVILHITSNELFKTVPLVLIIWWLWFMPAEDRQSRRIRLGSTIAASLLALVVARVIAAVAPYQTRPIHTPGLVVNMATGLDPNGLNHWNSFPSDHAALLIALAAGIATAHRGWGAVALVLAVLLGMVARVFLGLHWPADVFSGALIGIIAVVVSHRLLVPRMTAAYASGVIPLWQRKPHWFYVIAFFVCYQISSLFTAVRWFGEAAKTALGL